MIEPVEKEKLMKYLKQFGIILAFSFIGEMLNIYVPLPVPASIYGIIIMFGCLCTGIIKVKDIKETSSFLITIMPVMFIPAAVGLMNAWGILKDQWAVYLFITIVTTAIVMAVSGLATQGIIRYRKKAGEKSC